MLTRAIPVIWPLPVVITVLPWGRLIVCGPRNTLLRNKKCGTIEQGQKFCISWLRSGTVHTRYSNSLTATGDVNGATVDTPNCLRPAPRSSAWKKAEFPNLQCWKRSKQRKEREGNFCLVTAKAVQNRSDPIRGEKILRKIRSDSFFYGVSKIYGKKIP